MSTALAFLIGLLLAPKSTAAPTRPAPTRPATTPTRPAPRPATTPARPVGPLPDAVVVVAPPWPQATPAGLPPFPGPGWVPDAPPPLAVQLRAAQLLPVLWSQGEGATRTEQTAARWITYRATAMGGGTRGVVAYRLRETATASPVVLTSSTAPQIRRVAPSQPSPRRTPAKPTPAAPTAPTIAPTTRVVPATYIVQPGDNPSKIAERFTGNAANHVELARANPKRAPSGTFTQFWAGMTLTIPERWRR